MRAEDRVAKGKPFWRSLSQDRRLDLLSIPLNELKQRAAEVGARQREEQGGQGCLNCDAPDLEIFRVH